MTHLERLMKMITTAGGCSKCGNVEQPDIAVLLMCVGCVAMTFFIGYMTGQLVNCHA